jgi:hypothetical protein
VHTLSTHHSFDFASPNTHPTVRIATFLESDSTFPLTTSQSSIMSKFSQLAQAGQNPAQAPYPTSSPQLPYPPRPGSNVYNPPPQSNPYGGTSPHNRVPSPQPPSSQTYQQTQWNQQQSPYPSQNGYNQPPQNPNGRQPQQQQYQQTQQGYGRPQYPGQGQQLQYGQPLYPNQQSYGSGSVSYQSRAFNPFFDQSLILPYGRDHHKAKAATLPKGVNRAILRKADKDKVAIPSNHNMGNNKVDRQVSLQAQHRSKHINSCC